MKHYSVIWDGSESSIKEQMNFVTKWAKDNLVSVQHWKDKTIQTRVCQYVGNPKRKNKDYKFRRDNLDKKYTILRMSDDTLLKFKALVGQPFKYETKVQKEYAIVDAFTALKHSDDLINDYRLSYIKEKFNDEKTAVKEITARLTLNPNQKREFNTNNISKSRNGPTLWVKLEESIITTHDAEFQPWVVLDDAGLEQAGAEITKHSGVDTAALQKRERELIDAYNTNNIYCGRLRIMRADITYSDNVVNAYRARETAGRELKAVRRELGAAKRKMTTAAKKDEGIEYDLTAFSVL
jgi:hypothetical protein